MRDRNAEFASQQHARTITRQRSQTGAVDFFNLLTGPELLEMTDSLLPAHRERLFPPTQVLAMFMGQALSQDGSCQKAVDGWAAQRAADGLSVQSVNTGAYCKARQRLPIEMLSTLTRYSAKLLSEAGHSGWRWRDRCVKLVDGTGILMPDTAANQARYPQLSSQAEGVGSPLARLVGVICLSTGALLDAAMGPFMGKGTSELGLLRQIEAAFSCGDVMLADAFYCNYFLIAALQRIGVDVLFAQNGARNTDFRRGEKLGVCDHRVSWPKPKIRPDWMSAEDFAALPEQLTLREVKVGKKILVTTFLSPRSVSKTALGALFRQRWHVELDLRSIKTTLQMAELSCNTPEMNEKEVWVHFLAYNLIRILMAQAALQAAVHPRMLSFKHTMQLWSEWTVRRLCQHRDGSIDLLFNLIGQLRVGNRPGRIEPRARKRRPKP
ncbi:MAG: IS4 family transposase, partial [Terracidiphilus sp.]